jgi:phage terminase large subunit-like protein
MSAVKNPKLVEDLELLTKAQDWGAIRSWFGYWESFDDLLDKVLLFGHFFLPEYMRDASPVFHRALLADYFSPHNTYDAAPRGFSKTTLLQCAVLFECANRLQRFVVFIEKTFTEAAEVLSAVREECVENEDLIACYGNLLNNEASRIEGKHSKAKDAEGDLIINGVRLRAKGFDQPVRGLKSRAYRPTKIILDDCEQDSHIRNPDQRQKYEENFNKGVQPAIDIHGSIHVFGTILHEDSLLSNLIRLHGGRVFRAYYLEGEEDYERAKTFAEAAQVDGVGAVLLLWRSRWSWETLTKKRDEMRSKGLSINAFEQEYRNKPIAEEERKFRWEWLHNPLRRIGLDDLLKSGKTLVGYATIDAAESLNTGADSTASIVALIDPDGNWYLVDVRDDRRNITDLVALPFELWGKWKSHGLIKVGVERKAFADQMKPLLDEQKRLRNVFPVVEELKPMGRSKEGRILGALQGRFELGKVWVCLDAQGRPIGDTVKLLDQLYDFPSAAHDDLSDALAYISDIAQTPMKDENQPQSHRTPDDDPWNRERAFIPSMESEGVIRGMPHDVEEDSFL